MAGVCSHHKKQWEYDYEAHLSEKSVRQVLDSTKHCHEMLLQECLDHQSPLKEALVLIVLDKDSLNLDRHQEHHEICYDQNAWTNQPDHTEPPWANADHKACNHVSWSRNHGYLQHFGFFCDQIARKKYQADCQMHRDQHS